MTEKRWKRSEREIAALLGGERVPITGRRGADIHHAWLAPEVKTRQTLPSWLTEAMSQAKAAAAGHQLPLVVVHRVGDHHARDLVIVTLDHFRQWFGEGLLADDGA